MVDQNIAGYIFGMSLATAELPDDMVSLRAFALACQSELKVAELSVQYKALEIEKLKLQIAKHAPHAVWPLVGAHHPADRTARTAA
jgi:hypothetical protein